jgi:hypothetical protein
MIALGRSVSLTPSLNLRWGLGSVDDGDKDYWEMMLPVRLIAEDVDDFLLFVYGSLEKFNGFNSVPRITSLKLREEGAARTLSFVYDGRDSSVGVTWTTNVISVSGDKEGAYVASMESKGDRDACTTTGTFVRKIIILWSVQESQS